MCDFEQKDWYAIVSNALHDKRKARKSEGTPPNRYDLKVFQLQEHFRMLLLSVSSLAFQIDVSSVIKEFSENKEGKKRIIEDGKKDGKSTSQKQTDRKESSKMKSMDSKFVDNILENNFFTNSVNNNHDTEYLLGRSRLPSVNRSSEIPNGSDPIWKDGFFWKGVFFKILEQNEAKCLKNMLHNLGEIFKSVVDSVENTSLKGNPDVIVWPAFHSVVLVGNIGVFATPIIFDSTKLNERHTFSEGGLTEIRMLPSNLALLYKSSLGASFSPDKIKWLLSAIDPKNETSSLLSNQPLYFENKFSYDYL